MNSWVAMLFGPYAMVAAAIFAGGHLTSHSIPKRTFGLGTASALVAVAVSKVVASLQPVGHGSSRAGSYVVLCIPLVAVPAVGLLISKAFAPRSSRVAFVAGFFATLLALAWSFRLICNLYVLRDSG
jgi:hypothetical protein